MKQALAAIVLISFALLTSGCSFPTAYTISNRTQSDLTVVVTKTSCDQLPSRQDDYVHEGTVKRGRVEINHDGWADDDEVQCLRVLDPERQIILEERFQPSDGYDEPNTYTISNTIPISDAPMPKESDFPGPPLSERATDFAKSVGMILLVVVLIVAGLGFGLFFMTLFYGLPIYLAYLLVKAIVSPFRKPKPPLN